VESQYFQGYNLHLYISLVGSVNEATVQISTPRRQLGDVNWAYTVTRGEVLKVGIPYELRLVGTGITDKGISVTATGMHHPLHLFCGKIINQPCQHRLSQATTPSMNGGHHWQCMAKEHPFKGNYMASTN